MKTVFSKTEEVCAVWAAQEQPEARTSSNTRFRGPTLTSYGTPIARIVPASRGRTVALVSSNRWSSSTSKVQGEASGAARAREKAVYEVPKLGVSPGEVMANLEYFEREIEAAIGAIRKAVKWETARSHRQTAMRLIATASLYASDMGRAWAWRGENPLAVRSPKETF